MKPLTLDELRDLAPAFVMGTLSLEERRAFDSAMTDSTLAAALEPELAAHRAAAEFLATSQSMTPPPKLKGRVMSRIATEKVARGVAPAVQVERKTARGAWVTAGLLGIALAASLVFALDLRNETRSLRTQLDDQVAQAGQAKTQLAEREKLLATILGSGSDVTLVRLSPNQPTGPGMQVFWNTREGRAVVSASGLAQIASDRAYALWMIRDGKPVPIALFSPDASGRAIVQDIAVPTATEGVAAFAVTEEPAGGSPQPTMTPFLVGAVTRER